jgi:hypothetical protein
MESQSCHSRSSGRRESQTRTIRPRRERHLLARDHPRVESSEDLRRLRSESGSPWTGPHICNDHGRTNAPSRASRVRPWALKWGSPTHSNRTTCGSTRTREQHLRHSGLLVHPCPGGRTYPADNFEGSGLICRVVAGVDGLMVGDPVAQESRWFHGRHDGSSASVRMGERRIEGVTPECCVVAPSQ